MTRAAVDTLLYLLDEAYAGNDEHSLMANLRSVKRDDWLWKPAEGHRSIRRIAEHAGTAYWVYENHLFGDASMNYQSSLALAPSASEAGAMQETVDWIAQGFAKFRAGVGQLDDEALTGPSKTHYGPVEDTRFIISVMIGHAIYHAGEINHVRALRQGDDRWWPELVPQ
jgi:hypothetical protein